uniref:mt-LAF23 n=1 Tax=Trypanosoma brucei brucei TaxID=5702 RepID=UPI00178D0778|nr:Chain E3, mt-LAF23 [Trypanosoma brucei brucei]
MMHLSLQLCKPKTLAHMFRKLKLAGAHPDVLWAVDAQKAQHNSEEMIRLETMMHQRSTPGASNNRQSTAESFTFWLTDNQQQPRAFAAGRSSLRSVSCTINPIAPTRTIKQQLTQLFRDAGVYEDFEIGGEGVEMNLESVLLQADERQEEHLQQSGTLYIRGDKSIEMLRRFGVLLIIEEEGVTYLVTLPDVLDKPVDDTPSTYTPARSLIGPDGEIDPRVQDYIRDRGLRAFDLRMAGSHSSVERFVSAFERLERLYEVHRGRAMRSCVCLVLSIKAPKCYVAEDGCIVLSVQQMPMWEEFLLSLPQEVWQSCVQMHRDWRVGNAPKFHEQQRQLMKVADMFHFFRVRLDGCIGSQTDWQQQFILSMQKEEMIVRNAVKKYNLKSELLKRRGEICVSNTLRSAVDPTKEIGYRIGGDGRVYFNHSAMNTGQMLRALKDNLRRLETFQKQHDDAVATLEHMSRSIPVDFSVDTNWKLREEGNLVSCLQRFVRTIKANQTQLSAFLTMLLKKRDGAGAPKKRMVWIISERFDTLPSGVVYIPWDVDFDSIKKHLLPSG